MFSPTAIADDFDTVTGDITFAPGADSTQCFDVNVRPDKIVERPEQFSVLLSSNSDRVTITLGRALFTIIDNDGKYDGMYNRIQYSYFVLHLSSCLPPIFP